MPILSDRTCIVDLRFQHVYTSYAYQIHSYDVFMQRGFQGHHCIHTGSILLVNIQLYEITPGSLRLHSFRSLVRILVLHITGQIDQHTILPFSHAY